MTKRKDKKGGALKGRAMAAKDAVKSKATAVPGAGSVLNAVAEAADVANALAKEAEQQIGNRPGAPLIFQDDQEECQAIVLSDVAF